MKKSLTILLGMALVFSMVCCVGVVAGADVTTITPDTEGNPSVSSVTTTVSFSVSRDYTITIPDTITIGKDGGSGSAHIGVDIDNINANHFINVVIDDPGNYYNDTTDGGEFWEMKNSDEYIKFYVGVSGAADPQGAQHINSLATSTPLKPEDGVFSVPASVKTYVEATIHCLIPDYANVVNTIAYAGNYQGQLNFVVSIDTEAKASATGVVVKLVDGEVTFETSKGLGYPVTPPVTP